MDTLGGLRTDLHDRYEILRELGGGGMSRVFLAREVQLERQVVLKVLPPDLAAGIKTGRFQREIQVAARLRHPHIVPLLAAGQAGESLYYTMPFVKGPSLRERLEEGPPLSVGESLSILREVAGALAYAHGEGVVHRDIKPGNILLDSQHAVVVDFGVAKALTAAVDDSALTSTGLALGTPRYMAPEQALASVDVDGRADIYALGVVGYEMLAGRLPFSASTPQGMMVAHITASPQPLSELNAAVGTDAAQVVMRCLEKDPSARWQTAADLVHALEDAAAGFTPSRTGFPTVAVSEESHGSPDPGQLHGMTPGRLRIGERTYSARWVALGLVTALAAIAAVAALAIRNREGGPPREIALAILPFQNLDGDSSTDYMAAGITGEIQATLAKAEGIAVASSRSSSQFRDRDADVREISRRLNAAAIVEGTVHHVGNEVRVAVELTNGRTGYQLWSSEFRDNRSNMLGVQARIAQAIATALVGRLVPRRGHQLAGAGSVDPRAYDFYLKGKYLENDFTRTSLEEAIALYQLALSLEPSYAPAHSAIADATYHLADDYLPPREAYPRVRAAAQRAIELDSTLSNAHASLASYEISFGWNWPAARRHVDRAIALNPQSSFARMLSAWYYAIVGDPAAAVKEALSAASLDPLSDEIRGNVVSILRAAGRHDLAIAQARQMLATDVGTPVVLLAWIARGYIEMGQLDRAQAVLDTAQALTPGCCRRTIAILSAHKGDSAKAISIIDSLENARARQYYRAEFLAEARAALRDTSSTFDWLEEAYKDRSSGFPWFPRSPEIARFRTHPRFADLERRIGLQRERPADPP